MDRRIQVNKLANTRIRSSTCAAANTIKRSNSKSPNKENRSIDLRSNAGLSHRRTSTKRLSEVFLQQTSFEPEKIIKEIYKTQYGRCDTTFPADVCEFQFNMKNNWTAIKLVNNNGENLNSINNEKPFQTIAKGFEETGLVVITGIYWKYI